MTGKTQISWGVYIYDFGWASRGVPCAASQSYEVTGFRDGRPARGVATHHRLSLGVLSSCDLSQDDVRWRDGAWRAESRGSLE